MSEVDPSIVVGVTKDIETKEVRNGNQVTLYARTVAITTYEDISCEKNGIASTDLTDPQVNLGNTGVTGTNHRDARRNPVTGRTMWRKTKITYSSWRKLGRLPDDSGS